MNIHSPNTEKYVSSTDAVSKFPEKCTAIAARLNDNQELEVFIPFGTNDLTNFRVSPTPHYFSDKDYVYSYNTDFLLPNCIQDIFSLFDFLFNSLLI